MPKLTLEERRLQTLRAQLHGKAASSPKPRAQQEPTSSAFHFKAATPAATPSLSDQAATSYLRKDLLKIAILGTLAIAFQICLYSLEAKHLINLHF